MGINETPDARRLHLTLTPVQDDYLQDLVVHGKYLSKQDAIRDLLDRAQEGALV